MTGDLYNLEVNTQREPDATIVSLSGEVDLRTSPKLRSTFLELLDEKPARIVVNLADVKYVDSSGVGTIVELNRRALKADSKVVLVGLQQRVRSLFEITQLDKFFTITDSIDEARQI